MRSVFWCLVSFKHQHMNVFSEKLVWNCRRFSFYMWLCFWSGLDVCPRLQVGCLFSFSTNQIWICFLKSCHGPHTPVWQEWCCVCTVCLETLFCFWRTLVYPTGWTLKSSLYFLLSNLFLMQIIVDIVIQVSGYILTSTLGRGSYRFLLCRCSLSLRCCFPHCSVCLVGERKKRGDLLVIVTDAVQQDLHMDSTAHVLPRHM